MFGKRSVIKKKNGRTNVVRSIIAVNVTFSNRPRQRRKIVRRNENRLTDTSQIERIRTRRVLGSHKSGGGFTGSGKENNNNDTSVHENRVCVGPSSGDPLGRRDPNEAAVVVVPVVRKTSVGIRSNLVFRLLR